MNTKDTYKVTFSFYEGGHLLEFGSRCFLYYWQANVYSFCMYHFLGYECNTWKKKYYTKEEKNKNG